MGPQRSLSDQLTNARVAGSTAAAPILTEPKSLDSGGPAGMTSVDDARPRGRGALAGGRREAAAVLAGPRGEVLLGFLQLGGAERLGRSFKRGDLCRCRCRARLEPRLLDRLGIVVE